MTSNLADGCWVLIRDSWDLGPYHHGRSSYCCSLSLLPRLGHTWVFPTGKEPGPGSREALCGSDQFRAQGVSWEGWYLAGGLGAAGEGSLEGGYSLKWGDGICGKIIGGVPSFLVVEEFPLEVFAACHSPWL